MHDTSDSISSGDITVNNGILETITISNPSKLTYIRRINTVYKALQKYVYILNFPKMFSSGFMNEKFCVLIKI